MVEALRLGSKVEMEEAAHCGKTSDQFVSVAHFANQAGRRANGFQPPVRIAVPSDLRARQPQPTRLRQGEFNRHGGHIASHEVGSCRQKAYHPMRMSGSYFHLLAQVRRAAAFRVDASAGPHMIPQRRGHAMVFR